MPMANRAEKGSPFRRYDLRETTYARRDVVERCVNRLKQWRGIAARYEKRAVNYRAMVVSASLMIWLVSCITKSASSPPPALCGRQRCRLALLGDLSEQTTLF